jgi:excisionase family DNA binding protein
MTQSGTITTTKAAKILKVHSSTVNGLCAAGILPARKMGYRWAIDEDVCREFAKTYDNSRRPKTPNTAAFDKPVGRGWKTKRQKPQRRWASVQDQIEATMRGEIRPLYLTATNEVIR